MAANTLSTIIFCKKRCLFIFGYTDPIESLNIVVVSHYIRTQVPSCLYMTWLGLHKSPLGSLVEMSVALTELIFKKKSLRIFLVKIDKVFIVVNFATMKNLTISTRNIHRFFFLENQLR